LDAKKTMIYGVGNSCAGLGSTPVDCWVRIAQSLAF